MSAFKTLDDADVAGKRVLVRVDLNVPMEAGAVSDDTRIRAVVPTIRELAEKGARVVLLAHFGRPKEGPEAKFSLRQIVDAVADRVGRPIAFAEDCIGPVAAARWKTQSTPCSVPGPRRTSTRSDFRLA